MAANSSGPYVCMSDGGCQPLGMGGVVDTNLFEGPGIGPIGVVDSGTGGGGVWGAAA